MLEWIMKGKRKVHERRHREGAVTTERIPTGELSPGRDAVEAWTVVTGEDIGGMGFELDGGDCGYVPEDDAHIVIPDSSTVVQEKTIAEEEKDCECDYHAGGEKERKEKEKILLPETSSQPLFLFWPPLWQRLRRAYKTSCPEGFFAPVAPLCLILVLTILGRPVADGDKKNAVKSHSSSGSGSVGSSTSAFSSCHSVIVEACR
eukprot:206185_1